MSAAALTGIEVIEFEEVALSVEFIGMTVEKREDRLQFWDGILYIRDWWLPGLYHGQWPGRDPIGPTRRPTGCVPPGGYRMTR